ELDSWSHYRTAEAAELEQRPEGERVRLLGWISSKREHGGKIFLTLRDGSGYVQVVADKSVCEPEVFEQVSSVSQESSVAVEGFTSRDPRAPGGVEVHVTKIGVVAESEPWPITKSALKSPGFLYDMRHLTVRGTKTRATMKIRSELLKRAHRFFEENGYVWIQAPTLITSASEGGATLFEVEYYGDKSYLAQSAQLYEEAAICAFEKVYVIQPSFRAEKSRTRKHLTEFWHIEAEVAFATHDEIMEIQERLLDAMISGVVKNCQSELSELQARVEPPEPPLLKIPYDEALSIIEKQGLKIEWGDDFGAREERALSEESEEPFFVTKYPVSARPFYQLPDPEDERLTLSSDMFAPEGYGEITSGGQRIHEYDALVGRLREEGLDPKDYQWYLELRRFGMPPHSGFGLGLERTVRWILGLSHIRGAALFPRTPDRIYP
ncbi:MAG: asparagine--tRNA ligase, partial [Candidatus Geothermarchaeales archaeon]